MRNEVHLIMDTYLEAKIGGLIIGIIDSTGVWIGIIALAVYIGTSGFRHTLL